MTEYEYQQLQDDTKKKWWSYVWKIVKYLAAAIAGYGANEIPF